MKQTQQADGENGWGGETLGSCDRLSTSWSLPYVLVSPDAEGARSLKAECWQCLN
jgi:hypothetical protein